MATISNYNFLGLDPIGTTYLTSGDGYLHVYNWGPVDLIAAYISILDPVAPSTGAPVKAGEWTLLPADTEGAETRLAFVQAGEEPPGGGSIQLTVWTV